MGLAETAQCECGLAEQTSDHILQVCPFYEEKRCEVWTHDTSLHTKLWGHVNDLRRTAGFADSTRLTRPTRLNAEEEDIERTPWKCFFALTVLSYYESSVQLLIMGHHCHNSLVLGF